jgi:WD40 repeat protein
MSFFKGRSVGHSMKVWSIQTPHLLTWCPFRSKSRLFAAATPSFVDQTPKLSLYQLDFLNAQPDAKLVETFESESPYTAIDWSGCAEKPQGFLAAGHKDGTIEVIDPSNKNKFTISYNSSNNESISLLAFNPTQRNVLLTVSGDKNIALWDVTSSDPSKQFSVGGTSRSVSGNVTGVGWHRKATLGRIFGVVDTNGQIVIWDIGTQKSTHSFADTSFRSSLSNIAFAPYDPTTIATASNDSRNAVVYIWDLRNPNEPRRKLHGHTAGVVGLDWPSADERLLISSGLDGNVITWNYETGEQLNVLNEGPSPVSQIQMSPFIHGALLTSSHSGTYLYSQADPSGLGRTKLANPRYHERPSGVAVAFDGRIFQFRDTSLKSFEHREQIAEASDFLHFVEALETGTLTGFVREKLDSADGETERKLLEITQLGMERDTFRANVLRQFGIVASVTADDLQPTAVTSDGPSETDGSWSLFGSGPIESEAGFGSTDADVFAEGFAPFRVLPKETNSAEFVITNALISGNLQVAIDCAFKAERYADALLIASIGPPELFEATRRKYVRLTTSAVTRLVSHVSDHKLDTYVRYAEREDWRQVFAVISNFGGDSFGELAAVLGRRLVAEENDYEAALYCFIAAEQYDMVQQ